jgi:hypothetical protein
LYLPSKLSPKYIAGSALILLILILPFKSPLQDLFAFFSYRLIVSPHGYLQRIQEQKKENTVLSLQVRGLAYLKEENDRLRTALHFKENRGIELIDAEILFFDPSSWRRVITISAGSKKGVKEDSFVIDEEGWLIGKVSEVNENSSSVMLIGDPDFTLPVFVGEKAFGLLKGGLEGVKILYIENEDEIGLDDKVWLKIPYLAAPVYIGDISTLKRNKNTLFWDVGVRVFSGNPFSHTIFVIQ